MTTDTPARLDTSEMVVVHRLFRRESRLLVELTAAVPPGDRARARVVVGHLRDYCSGLSIHHGAEDELLWPKLLARVDHDADVVLRMEAEHELIAGSVDRVGTAADAWEAVPGVAEREALVAALTAHRTILLEHLDAEETTLLPLAREHLTVAEWQAQGEHFATHTPKSKLLLFLGMALEEADPAERARMLGGMPLPARVLWHTVGRLQYARHIRRVRG